MENAPHTQAYLSTTQKWVKEWVIGLNLCPFAAQPFQEDRIRYVVCLEQQEEQLLQELYSELIYLQQHSPKQVETTLLIHPLILTDFYDYNDFLGLAEELLISFQWDGEFQIASFHPKYQFADTEVHDVTNRTNRSPFPMLHLLREDSISEAVEHYDTAQIPERNMALMRKLYA